jgi:hypothetical protein
MRITNSLLTKLTSASLLFFCPVAALAQGAPARGSSTSTTTVSRTITPDARPATKSAETKVKINFPSTDEAGTADFDLRKVAVKAEKVSVTSELGVASSLKEGGIEPDVRALSLIYDLNPEIERLDAIPPGTVLELPRLRGDAQLKTALGQGYTATLAYSSSAVKKVNEQTAELGKLSQEAARLDANEFGGAESKQEIMALMATAQTSLAEIGSEKYPVPQQVLRQSALEAGEFRRLIAQARSSSGAARVQANAEAQKIASALEARSADIKSGGSGGHRVEVHTVKQSDGTEVLQKRVFYAPKLDPDQVEKYPSPSSPTSKSLPIGAELTFWAGEGDDPKPISDKVTIVVQAKNDPIKLQIKP